MSEAILEMQHITKAFSGIYALKDAQLTLHKGSVMALVGENGAGKSTLMRRVGIPSLRTLGHERDAVLDCAEGAVSHNWFHIMAPKPVDSAVMRELLGRMYDTYL